MKNKIKKIKKRVVIPFNTGTRVIKSKKVYSKGNRVSNKVKEW